MKGEINNFIMVWTSVLLGTLYCYVVSKFVPKGVPRFMAILPVVCLFMVLPLNLKSIHLGCVSFFYIAWIANFKLILLSFGIGPLSDPSLQMAHFIGLACLPIKLLKTPTPRPPSKADNNDLTRRPHSRNKMSRPVVNEQKNKQSSNVIPKKWVNSVSHYATKFLFLGLLVYIFSYRKFIHPQIIMFFAFLYLYIGLEILLGVPGIIAHSLLGFEIEQPFNRPNLSTSLQDFWGQRWNLISKDALRSTVFNPIFHHVSSILGPHWASIAAIMSSFFVSAFMHELLFYHVCRVLPTWGSTFLFPMQGLFLTAEIVLKKKIRISWQLPRIITGPLIFVFMMSTFMWLVMPIAEKFNIVIRAVEEWVAFGEFALDLALSWNEKCCYLLIHYLMPRSSSY